MYLKYLLSVKYRSTKPILLSLFAVYDNRCKIQTTYSDGEITTPD